jgi:hypothetical protein
VRRDGLLRRGGAAGGSGMSAVKSSAVRWLGSLA